MEQQHYFPPLHGAADCEKCEAWDWENSNGTGVI